MHRSGTSALSGVLAQLGVQPPKNLMAPAQDNPRGFWESKDIVMFHERLLTALGSAWSDWGEIDDALMQSEAAVENLALLPRLIDEEFGDARMFFVKDPRMCRFPAVWLRALAEKGIDAKAVIPIRHPAEVASSLEARNHLGTLRSRLIWLRHALDAEYATRDIRRTVVPFPRLLASWRTEVERMALELAVEWPVSVEDAQAGIDEFLHAGLRHFAGVAGPVDFGRLDEWVNATYRLLQELGGAGEADARQRLDEIRRDFNLAASLFAPVFQEDASAHAKALSDLRMQLEARPAEFAATVERKLADAMSKIQAEQRSELSKLGAKMSALADELRAGQQLADVLQSKIRAQDGELVAMRRRLDQSSELYRKESSKRQAIHAELERIVADQKASLDRSAAAMRTGNEEIKRLRTAEAAHAHEADRLRAELASQRRIAQQAMRELEAMRGSRAWRILDRLRRAVGRAPVDVADELTLEARAIEQSGLFDRQWYLERYPDVARDGMDPLEHYLRFGAAELRDPSDRFDARGYVDRYPDVRAAGINPLVHYVRFGRDEGRSGEAVSSD